MPEFSHVGAGGGGSGDFGAFVTKSADQVVVGGSEDVLTWNQETYDTDGMHDNVVNNSRLTFNTAGKYGVCLTCEDETSAGWCRTVVRLNGSTRIGGHTAPLGLTGAQGGNTSCPPARSNFVVGDYVEALCLPSAGMTVMASVSAFWAQKMDKGGA